MRAEINFQEGLCCIKIYDEDNKVIDIYVVTSVLILPTEGGE